MTPGRTPKGERHPARRRLPVGAPPRLRLDRWARPACATGLLDAGGNHPPKGDDDPGRLGQNLRRHLEQKGRCNGHSLWVYWAPFFLAVGAPLPGVPRSTLGQRRYLSQPADVLLYR